MSINPKILREIEKIIEDENVKSFINELLVLENRGLPHYKETYKSLINEYCKGCDDED